MQIVSKHSQNTNQCGDAQQNGNEAICVSSQPGYLFPKPGAQAIGQDHPGAPGHIDDPAHHLTAHGLRGSPPGQDGQQKGHCRRQTAQAQLHPPDLVRIDHMSPGEEDPDVPPDKAREKDRQKDVFAQGKDASNPFSLLILFKKNQKKSKHCQKGSLPQVVDAVRPDTLGGGGPGGHQLHSQKQDTAEQG